MARFLPFLAILAAVVISAVPWGLPGETAFVPPLVVLSLVFLYSGGPDEAIPAWFAFAAGLLADILTAGPLGYWAVLFLATHLLAHTFVAPAARGRPALVWIGFAVVVSLVMGSGWVLASLYYMHVFDPAPMALAVLAAMAIFPALQWLLGGRRNDRAEEGP